TWPIHNESGLVQRLDYFSGSMQICKVDIQSFTLEMRRFWAWTCKTRTRNVFHAQTRRVGARY
ncbi:MAG: hypothetical protein ACREA7_04425, partial [Nitrosotalea sp.]